MTVGITDLAHSIRKNSAGLPQPIPLSHGQQLVCAALGHKSFASFQAAQNVEMEPQSFEGVPHVVPDHDLLVSRAAELKLDLQPPELQELIAAAFAERLPKTKLHGSYDSLAADFHDDVQHAVSSNDRVSDAMANANYDGVDEVYLENDLEPGKATVSQPYTKTVPVQITLGIDPDRPYSGHKVHCEVAVTTVCIGRRCFEVPEVKVLSASLDTDWGESDDPEDEAPAPLMTLAEALAAKLGVSVEEAEELVDADPVALTSHTGDILTGYEFDFTHHASPALAAKLMKKHGSLRLRVDQWFIDSYRNDDFPR